METRYILPVAGHETIAGLIKASDVYIAWGGLPPTYVNPWTTSPPLPVPSDGMLKTLGYRKANQVEFVELNPAGPIEVDRVKWSTATKSRHLYISTIWDEADDPDAIIYQVGIFLNAKEPALLANKYCTAVQMENPGKLLTLCNVSPIYRSVNARESRKLIIAL